LALGTIAVSDCFLVKIAATRSHLLKLKYTTLDFGWGSAPDTAGGALSAPPDLLPEFQRVLLLRERRGGEERRTGKGRKGVKGGQAGEKQKENGWREGKRAHLIEISGYATGAVASRSS